jgi:hypothetical protein
MKLYVFVAYWAGYEDTTVVVIASSLELAKKFAAEKSDMFRGDEDKFEVEEFPIEEGLVVTR